MVELDSLNMVELDSLNMVELDSLTGKLQETDF